MGAVKRRMTPSTSVTSEIKDWISLIKIKKLNFKAKQRKNLLVEAVLNKALFNAETKLRQKQQERRLRWQHLKSKWAIAQSDCDTDNPIDWDTSICEELTNSLDDFMLITLGGTQLSKPGYRLFWFVMYR
ncbi:hypothetical protein NQ318_004025 [Aromia moschata]|uniref:Uncharacterized protein n=1 Tax=Aromia moschata TaxID=1265417 RepID=A0AAV8Z826_9CUCU|nr:hypothetical protein NQ318_004025 [Aromia moschata]